MTRQEFLTYYYSKYNMASYVHFVIIKLWKNRRKLELNGK